MFADFIERYFEAVLHAGIAVLQGIVVIAFATLGHGLLAAIIWLGCAAFWFWWELRQHGWSFARMGAESWRELIAPDVVLLIVALKLLFWG